MWVCCVVGKVRQVVQQCCHCEVCTSCAATLGSMFLLPLWSGTLNALRSSGQRRRIKEREKREGRGREGRSGVAVPWMFLTPTFVPWWSVSPLRPCTQRVPFKTGVGSFSWQGMDWCGRQPGCDRGGALAEQDKSPLFATFGEVTGREGQGGGCQQMVLIPTSLAHIASSSTTTTHLRCHRQMKGFCVFRAGFVNE